uniref:Uncharacterized protein n=1 Tax=Arabidopsis thaliana TaxID=3702 RepID=Q0WTD8_ARATH|nr:hypothetical protein [Arabidopsis thaliana]
MAMRKIQIREHSIEISQSSRNSSYNLQSNRPIQNHLTWCSVSCKINPTKLIRFLISLDEDKQALREFHNITMEEISEASIGNVIGNEKLLFFSVIECNQRKEIRVRQSSDLLHMIVKLFSPDITHKPKPFHNHRTTTR